MATIQPVFGYQLLIKVGDGETPEVFAHPALINTSRGITFSTSTETDELMDVSNHGAPAITVRRIRSKDVKIDGSGMIHAPDLPEYLAWAASGEIKNIEVTIGGVVMRGPFVLTNFQVSADRVKTVEVQLTLEQADDFKVVTP